MRATWVYACGSFCHNPEDVGDKNDRMGQRKMYAFWKNQKGKPRKTNSSLGREKLKVMYKEKMIHEIVDRKKKRIV